MTYRASMPWRRDPILPLVPSPPSSAPALRYLATIDMPECLHISKYCRPGGGDEPIRRHLSRGSPTIGIVAVLAGETVGYLLYTTVVAGRDSWLELADIGVDPLHRRRGVGSALLRWLRGRLSDRAAVAPRHRIESSVPGRAVGLQLFLRGRGYLAVPDAAGRFVGAGDAIRFRYEVADDTGCEGAR